MTIELNKKFLNSFSKNHEDQIVREYAKALIDIREELADAYSKHGPLTMQEMNKYNRLQNLEKSIFTELDKVTDTTKLRLMGAVEESYESAYYRTAHGIESEIGANMNFFTLSPEQVQKSIENPLDRYGAGTQEDSLGFLMRHTDNQTRLKGQIQSALTQSIVRGESYEQASRRLTERMNIGANSALRIARTEMHRCQVSGVRDAIMTAGKRTITPKKVTLAYFDPVTNTYLRPNTAEGIKSKNKEVWNRLRKVESYPVESMKISPRRGVNPVPAEDLLNRYGFDQFMAYLDPKHPFEDDFNGTFPEQVTIGITMVWNSATDEKVRPEHGHMDGKKSDEDGKFDFPGIGLVEGPGMTGAAEHDINCRCAVVGDIPGLEPLKRRLGTGEVVDHISYEDYAKKRGWKTYEPPPPPKEETPEERSEKFMSKLSEISQLAASDEREKQIQEAVTEYVDNELKDTSEVWREDKLRELVESFGEGDGFKGISDNFLKKKVISGGGESFTNRVKNTVAEGAEWLRSAVHPDVIRKSKSISQIQADSSRASYSFRQKRIKCHTSTSTFIHEYSHHLHENNNKTSRTINAFFNRRTKGEKLTTIYAGTDEVGYRDKFTNHYTGRVYDHDRPGALGSEVLSMGIQQMYESPDTLYERDRELFNLVFGIMKGATL